MSVRVFALPSALSLLLGVSAVAIAETGTTTRPSTEASASPSSSASPRGSVTAGPKQRKESGGGGEGGKSQAQSRVSSAPAVELRPASGEVKSVTRGTRESSTPKDNATSASRASDTNGSATPAADISAKKPQATERASKSASTDESRKRTTDSASKASKGSSSRGTARVSSESTSSKKAAPTSVNSTETDPELLALQRAERILFPQALRGIRPTFSFDSEMGYSGAADDSVATGGRNATAKEWFRDLVLPPNFPNVDGRIITYLEFYRSEPEGKSILRAWAKKRGRYEGSVSATLLKAGLPKELVFQSLVESAFNPLIKSPAGAVGLWQFMPETARLYGLTVDRWTDERLDPERATQAAAKMMGRLYQRFGNWELALAAYNMGEAGLLRSIRKYNTNDFWALSRYESGLPFETALYVPRIISITIAMNNLQAFGIEGIVPDEPVAFDAVLLPAGVALSAVARAAEMTEEELSSSNPQLLAGRLPPSAGTEQSLMRVYVPRGKGEIVRARLSRMTGPEADLEAYVVKRGESAESIALSRGISIESFRTINRMLEGEILDPLTVVLVPRNGAADMALDAAADDRIAVVLPDAIVPKDRRRVFYRVSTSDTLSSIATVFGVTRVEILEQNCLDPSARIQPNMLLSILLPKDRHPKGVFYREEKDVRLLVVGSDEFYDYFEAQRGNERLVVQAREKDTLATIGTRHGVTVGTMERINRRSRRDVLTPGESVVVYVKRAGESERLGRAE